MRIIFRKYVLGLHINSGAEGLSKTGSTAGLPKTDKNASCLQFLNEVENILKVWPSSLDAPRHIQPHFSCPSRLCSCLDYATQQAEDKEFQ